MTDDFKISMHRLNPTHKVDNEIFMGFFPPNKNYYSELLQNEHFKLFLTSDSTTKEGQYRIADYYQVGCGNKWTEKIVHMKDTSNCWC
jgi:hypothetical protein